MDLLQVSNRCKSFLYLSNTAVEQRGPIIPSDKYAANRQWHHLKCLEMKMPAITAAEGTGYISKLLILSCEE